MVGSVNSNLNDKEWLEREFITNKRKVGDIALELGVHRTSVSRALRRAGMHERRYRSRWPELDDREWLAKQLETKTQSEIATEIGCAPGNIADRIRRYKIPYASSKSEAIKKSLARRYPNGRFGEQSSNWRGGRQKVNGYIAVTTTPGHLRASTGNRVFEHILVAEKKLGRPIENDEVVHHINGNKQDNRPENLEVCKRSEHVNHHMVSGEGIQSLRQRIAKLEQKLLDNNVAFD